MPFDWRFRNFKREPEPFLNGAVIDAENARNNLVQNAGNDMEGYTPLESTLAAQAMEGYKPVVPATQSQLAAGASQAMQGYTPNSAGRPSVPNDMHGGMGQPDLEGYGESLQAASDAAAQAQAKEQQIADIESQISALEKRIAENKTKLQKWTGNADQIAAIEARKINSQDPTMIWRWKMGQDAAKQQRADDLKRIEAEKQKTESKNKQMNQYKIDNILQGAMPSNARTRDELNMMQSKLNDAEELAKQYGDTDMLKKIDTRRAALQNHEPVSEKSNRIESDFIKNLSMVGKVGGMKKKDFIAYVNDVLNGNDEVWRYNPALQQKLYQAIGQKAPSPKGEFEL